VVTCLSVSGFAGLLGFEPFPGIRLGKELAEIARTNGLGGVIHSDEFGKQGIAENEAAALRSLTGATLVPASSRRGRGERESRHRRGLGHRAGEERPPRCARRDEARRMTARRDINVPARARRGSTQRRTS